eukprot:390807_1
MSHRKEWYYTKDIYVTKYGPVSFERILQLCNMKKLTNEWYVVKRKDYNGPYTKWINVSSIGVYEYACNFTIKMQPLNQHKYLQLIYQLRCHRDDFNIEIKSAIKAIKNTHKKYFNEIKALHSPPQIVHQTLLAVGYVLNDSNIRQGFKGEFHSDWSKAVRMIGNTNNIEWFKKRLIKFQSHEITQSALIKLEQEFLSNEKFNYDKIHKISKGCGPLVLWVRAHCKRRIALYNVDRAQLVFGYVKQFIQIKYKSLQIPFDIMRLIYQYQKLSII